MAFLLYQYQGNYLFRQWNAMKGYTAKCVASTSPYKILEAVDLFSQYTTDYMYLKFRA